MRDSPDGQTGEGVAAVCVLALAACGAPATAAAPRTVDVEGAVPAIAPVLVPSLITRPRGWSFSAVATADLDGDGRRDVVALDPQRRGVVLARSLGGGRFATRRLPRLFGPGTGGQLAVGDLDRDGRPDLVTTGSRAGAVVVQVAYGTRSGFLRARSSGFVAGGSPGSIPASDIAVGDADGDRRPDVIVGLIFSDAHHSRPGDGVVVLRSRPGRRFAARVRPTAVRAGRDSGIAVPQLLTGDLDADGALDLVFRDVVVRGLGRGRFAAPEGLALGSRGVNGFSVTRALVARRGRIDVLAAHRRASDAVERLGIVTRGAKALRLATITGLQSRADSFSRFSVDGRRGALAAGRLRRGRESDVALATSDAIWLTRTTDGRRFSAAVPTIVPFGEDRRIVIADLDGDQRAEVVSSDASGRLMLLRAGAPKSLVRPVLPPSAPFITADQAAYPVVSCTLGAGACIGSLTLPGGRCRSGSYRAREFACGYRRAPRSVLGTSHCCVGCRR